MRTIGVFLPVTRRCCCKAPNFGARQRSTCKQQVVLQMLLLLPKQGQRDTQAAGEQHPVLALHTHLITITSHTICHSQCGWIFFPFSQLSTQAASSGNEVKGLSIEVVVKVHLTFQGLQHAPVLYAKFPKTGDAHEEAGKEPRLLRMPRPDLRLQCLD